MSELSEFIAGRNRHQATLEDPDTHRQKTDVKNDIAERGLHQEDYLREGAVHLGDATELLSRVPTNSISLSIWSPPYFVGKAYESHLTFDTWKELLRSVIKMHFPIVKPGGFLAINIADILCFRDEAMPKVQAEVLSARRSSITRQQVLDAQVTYPGANRYQLAKLLGCSEQTIDRRLNGNNIRGGKYETQTRTKIVGGVIEEWALESGFYPYDRRIWMKDPAWENSKWASSSYRAVDEFEYIYFLWKPGTTTINRGRLTAGEWKAWGARGIWQFPSVRTNDDHEAKFPLELPRRVIRLLTEPGELVLDCFMGSGTTAIAAIQEGRRFIGIEREMKYVELAMSAVGKMLPFPHANRAEQLGTRHGASGRDRKVLDENGSSSAPRFSRNSG